jgi:hypothetical protein
MKGIEEGRALARGGELGGGVELKPGRNVNDRAKAAAAVAAGGGASPRGQIDAARQASGQPLFYLPHQGARERARRARRMGAA